MKQCTFRVLWGRGYEVVEAFAHGGAEGADGTDGVAPAAAQGVAAGAGGGAGIKDAVAAVLGGVDAGLGDAVGACGVGCRRAVRGRAAEMKQHGHGDAE